MKLVDSGGLPCQQCGSPLTPCKCEREAARPRVRGWNTTLRVDPKKGLRSRTLKEKFGDDPLRYGPLWDEVRREPCMGLTWLPRHQCKPGYAPPTAHHLEESDLEGMVPCCGWLHDRLELAPDEVAKELTEAASPSLQALGDLHILAAAARLREKGEMPPEIEEALAGHARLCPPIEEEQL